VQELPPPWSGWLAIVYQCTHTHGTPTPDDVETDAARFFSLEQLDALDEPIEPWSDWLMRRVLRNACTVTPPSEVSPFSPHPGFV